MAHILFQLDYTVAVFVVCRGKVLLVHHAALQQWLPLGGHIELGEDPETAALREVREESGLEVTLIGYTPRRDLTGCKSVVAPLYMDVHQITDSHRHLGMVYFAHSSSQEVVLAAKEHINIGWFSKEQLGTLSPRLLDSVGFYAEEALASVRTGATTVDNPPGNA